MRVEEEATDQTKCSVRSEPDRYQPEMESAFFYSSFESVTFCSGLERGMKTTFDRKLV